MQFCGFDLWKHLCKQANHVAAILNQKPCNFALIKFLKENHHVIVMGYLDLPKRNRNTETKPKYRNGLLKI